MHERILSIPVCSGLAIDMIHVDGGLFDMGGELGDDEKPIHQVRLSPFYLGRYPVTQSIWQAVMGENPSKFKGSNRPVDSISWNDAQKFIEKLSLMTSRDFCLPTEAQWEYAARGGRKSLGFDYSGSNHLKEVVWYAENSYGETKPVGLKFANELGFYDISGNVWEWCADWYDSDYYVACSKEGVVTDPPGPDQGGGRVLRGGGSFSDAVLCRTTYRIFTRPDYRWSHYGVRLALPVSPAEAKRAFT
jgi:formylglycine-generating enzyme required for sulfatase activity